MICPDLAPVRRALSFVTLTVVCGLLLGAISAAAAQKDSKRPDLRKEYALIFGTVWGKDDRPAYGVTVKIRRADQKKAGWVLMSDHKGEFAQRVPPGMADYIIWAEVKRPKGKARPETKVHVENDERVDIALHLTE